MNLATYRDVKLEDLPDDEFHEIVDRELRKDHPSTPSVERDRLYALATKLRHQAVVVRWITELEIMKASAETQLGAKAVELKALHGIISEEEYLDRLRGYQKWRAGTLRFLNSVQQRLLEARYARYQLFGFESTERVAEERDAYSEAMLRFTKAVEKHRKAVLARYDPTDADESLWAVIEQKPKERSFDHDKESNGSRDASRSAR